jgi:hypothetical protein
MPKITVTQNLILPPSWFNAVARPLFNDGTEEGENPRITDDMLSNTPGQIKSQWQGFRDGLAVTAGSGTTINIAGGAVTGDAGNIVPVVATSRSLSPNAITFVWVDAAGNVQTGTSLPVQACPIARVTTLANSTISAISDLRGRFAVLPQMRAVPVFGGNATANVNYASNASFSDGRIDCNNFTIQSGVTLTIPNGFLWIEAAGDVTIPGTINITAPIAGGGAFSGGALVQYYAIESGRGLGGGGYSGGAAAPYPHYASPFGSGGASGFGSVSGATGGTIFQSRGGNGGGVVVIRAAGRIIITGAINCDGAAGTAGTASGSPPGVVVLTGGGGGSGGLILLQSLTSIAATAGQLSVRGGAGAAGFSINYSANLSQGGGGGGGGRIIAESPSVNLTGTSPLTTGGAAGLNFGSGNGVSGAIGGSFGGTGGIGGSAGGSGILSTRLIVPS